MQMRQHDPLNYPEPDEVRIKRKRLELLEKKARAHDAYRAATVRMRVRQETTRNTYMKEGYEDGYNDALREFAEMIVEESRDVD
jgi:hypothetical protein